MIEVVLMVVQLVAVSTPFGVLACTIVTVIKPVK